MENALTQSEMIGAALNTFFLNVPFLVAFLFLISVVVAVAVHWHEFLDFLHHSTKKGRSKKTGWEEFKPFWDTFIGRFKYVIGGVLLIVFAYVLTGFVIQLFFPTLTVAELQSTLKAAADAQLEVEVMQAVTPLAHMPLLNWMVQNSYSIPLVSSLGFMIAGSFMMLGAIDKWFVHIARIIISLVIFMFFAVVVLATFL